MALKSIYELTGADFLTRLVIMHDFAGACGHAQTMLRNLEMGKGCSRMLLLQQFAQ